MSRRKPCDNPEPHEPHEWIDAAFRWDCPGEAPHEPGCTGPEHADTYSWPRVFISRVRTCCAPPGPPPPPPSPADLQREADDTWLARQHQLAEEVS